MGDWRDYTICEYGNARMIRKNGYKLILRFPFQNVNFVNELYDLRADPRETTNLYDNSSPQYRQIIKEMTDHLDHFFSNYSIPAHDGLNLEHQPMATPYSPWLEAAKLNKQP